MRFFVCLVVLVAVIFATACESTLVRKYCDSEVEYSIHKNESGFALYLKIGQDNSPYACRISARQREVNMSAKTSSVEEALRIVYQHRDEYRLKRAKKAAGNKP